VPIEDDEPCLTIGVVQVKLGLHPQTIRHWEKLGLVRPYRVQNGTRVRMFSAKDLERLAQIKAWIDELGVNLAGVDVMLRMQDQIDRLREESVRDRAALIEQYEAEIAFLKKQLSGDATAQDTAAFVDRLKAAHAKKTDALEKLVAQLRAEAQRKDREIADLVKDNKRLRADFDKTLSKEKLAELVKD